MTYNVFVGRETLLNNNFLWLEYQCGRKMVALDVDSSQSLCVLNVMCVRVCMCVCVLQDKLMHFPTWIDLKGQDSVPDTVHHVVIFLSAM